MILLLLLCAACQVTRTSPFFHGLGNEARDFVARSAPEATWTTRLETEPRDALPPLLPCIQLVAFETEWTLDEAEARDLHDRLEFEIVRSLLDQRVRFVSRHEVTSPPEVRGVCWEYDTGGRHAVLSCYGVRRGSGYEVIFTVCEMAS